MKRLVLCAGAALLASATVLFSQSAQLTVIDSGPAGELQKIDQAREIRVVFSEPMVALGRIPANPSPGWIRIAPALRGAFRWSGTTTLIFTPDPASPPPFATRFTVTIDAGAESAAGRRLAQPHSFSFVTPTVRLEAVRWARRGGRFDDPVTLALSFNQPVRQADVLAHLTVRYRSTDFTAPTFTAAERARLASMDAEGLRRFDQKVADARRNATRTDAIGVQPAKEWDRTLFRPTERDVMLETSIVPPPGTTLLVEIDATMPSPQGPERPGSVQRSSAPLPAMFFVTEMDCRTACESSYGNRVGYPVPVTTAQFASAFRATDVTTGNQPVPRGKGPIATSRDVTTSHSVEDAGFERQPAGRTWMWQLDASLQASDGQTLGYPWIALVETWNDRAFTSFGDGHGLWEAAGGPSIPYYSRNYQSVTERVTRVPVADLVTRLAGLEEARFAMMPPVKGTERRLAVRPNVMQSYGLDLSSVLGSSRTGIFWAGVNDGDPIERARTHRRTTSTLVQVTNLGVTVKDSPQSTLIFVTRLDNGEPVADANVSLVTAKNKTLWRGRTARDGVALAPALPLRESSRWYELAFVAIAEKDGDVAYVASDWNEGVHPWEFNLRYNITEATDILRGSVFTDRGVYKAGETVQFKLIARLDTPRGIRLLPSGSDIDITIRDARNQNVDTRTVRIGRWSSAEWTWTLPAGATLGNYRIDAQLPLGKPKTTSEGDEVGDDDWLKVIQGGFLVAAYRRPDFQVQTSLASTGGSFAGSPLNASATATYLFGGTMAQRPVSWSLTRAVEYGAVPAVVREKFPDTQYHFGYYLYHYGRDETRVAGETAVLGPGGTFARTLTSDKDVDIAYRYTFEADVEDVSRQHIANRSSIVLHPASFYLGVRTAESFFTAGRDATAWVVAAGLDGRTVPGVTASASLVRVQWNSIRRATGDGFYEWDSERIEIPVATVTVTTAEKPVPFTFKIPEGGSYAIRVTARDGEGRRTRTDVGVYAAGPGYTAWERYDHNRIDLEPERRTYKPGETAKIMIKSPWERATALLTIEREGIRQHQRFDLTSTQQTVDVPITAADIPNVFVSVLLVRGRTSQDPGADGSDPGRPAFRLGYTELLVADETKRLDVKVAADREEYRPANSARVTVSVLDSTGKPARSEVTLWAVDTGVLALTEYEAPDVADTVYLRKALQVMNSDNRQRLISRRVLTPKGGDEGGGGGMDTARTDFRPLAFWLGSVETDASGRATRAVTLPDTLTSYRIMAVAADTTSRFGSGAATIRVSKPIVLLPALPRFLALSDRASFGALVSNTLATATDAVVTIRSLTPALLEVQGQPTANVRLEAGATAAVRFDAIARGVGPARVRVSVTAGANSDSFEMALPVGAPARLETSAAFGETTSERTERIALPAGVLPTAGGLTVDLASSALVGLGDGARYLIDYPYGCAEQKASAAHALMLAHDLGHAFALNELKPAEYRARAQAVLDELGRYQCSDGGFGYWPGGCQFGNFYLTGYLLHVMHVADRLGMQSGGDKARALDFLEAQLRSTPPQQVQWLPAWSAASAFGVRVLTEYGRQQDANVTRLSENLDHMPIFALSYLADAMATSTPKHPRYADVIRRLTNAVRVEGDRAHVQELDSDALVWLWNSNVRSTALVLDGLVRRGDDPTHVTALVRGLLNARRNGRWNNTQENATALEALVSYYRKYEAEPPDFTASVAAAGRPIGSAVFKGRSTTTQTVRLAMPEMLKLLTAGAETELTMSRAGSGRLYYTARVQYQPSTPLPSANQGIQIERRFARFSEAGDGAPATTFAAGDLIRVTLIVTMPQERRYVAVVDPLAAGFEPVDGWFRTTAADLARDGSTGDASFMERWRRGGFDYVEKHDDRVSLFATRLSAGRHEFSYLVRATTAGTFTTGGTWAEEMYAPEVHGRGEAARITIK